MTPIYVGTCDCGDTDVVEIYKTDIEVCHAVYDHWVRRYRELGRLGPEHRHWRVHGPGGHALGVHDAPWTTVGKYDLGGELPPHPPPLDG